MSTFTVGDLISMLEQYDADLPVKLATQPGWPFEHALRDEVVEAEGAVWLSEGEQAGYLPTAVAEELGWR